MRFDFARGTERVGAGVRPRKVAWCGSLVLAIALFSGCSSRMPVEIIEGGGSPTGRTLQLAVASCNATNLHVDVQESPTQVVVTVTIDRVGGAHGECADLAFAALAEPLGERSLIDGATGHEVRVQTPESTG